MIICLPHHPNYLSKDPESISRTFLEQFALVYTIYYSSSHQDLLWMIQIMSLYSGHRQATSKNFLNLQNLSVQHTLMRSSDSGPLDLAAAEVTTGCDWVELMSFLFPLHLRA